MIVIMTVIGSFGSAEDAVMILIQTVVSLLIIIRLIIKISGSAALATQTMLQW